MPDPGDLRQKLDAAPVSATPRHGQSDARLRRSGAPCEGCRGALAPAPAGAASAVAAGPAPKFRRPASVVAAAARWGARRGEEGFTNAPAPAGSAAPSAAPRAAFDGPSNARGAPAPPAQGVCGRVGGGNSPCEDCGVAIGGATAPAPAPAIADAAVTAGPAPRFRRPASVVAATARWGRKGGGEERFTNTLEARLPVRRRRRRGAQAPCGFCGAGGAAAAAPAGDAAAMAAGAAPNIRRRISSRFHGQRDAGGAPALPPAPAGRAAPGE